jgi:hypothetical protein
MSPRARMILLLSVLALVYILNAITVIASSNLPIYVGVLIAVLLTIPFSAWFIWEGKRQGFLDILLKK